MTKLDIKLVATDIDGVWTDGGMYYDQTGNEWKRFNTYDGVGVNLARKAGLKVAIVTGEQTSIVERRAAKLGVQDVFQNVGNKLEVIDTLCARYGLQRNNVAYIGDDINDIEVLKQVGLSAVPINAPDYVKKHAAMLVPVKGGDGAFRAFVEHIIQHVQKNDIESLL